MEKIICFDGNEIHKVIYLISEYKNKIECGKSTLYFVSNSLKPSDFKSVFEEYNIPKDMQKVFFYYNQNDLNLAKFKISMTDKRPKIKAREVITNFPITLSVKREICVYPSIEYSYVTKEGFDNFSLNGGSYVSNEYLKEFLKKFEGNKELLSNYLECLKKIINVDFYLSDNLKDKYLTKK